MDRCFVVQNENLDKRDFDLFFAECEVEVLPAGTSMLDVLVECGIFPSKGQARKNGWKDDKSIIPDGFSEVVVGKKKHCITILNPSSPWD
jgi:hypothetical protein